jgi:hypothetical protein
LMPPLDCGLTMSHRWKSTSLEKVLLSVGGGRSRRNAIGGGSDCLRRRAPRPYDRRVEGDGGRSRRTTCPAFLIRTTR